MTNTNDEVLKHLRTLDGSKAAAVAMLAGCTREELDELGGVTEDDLTGGK